jgi:hypothetical protein
VLRTGQLPYAQVFTADGSRCWLPPTPPRPTSRKA